MAKAKPYGYIFIIALVLIVILAGPSFFKAGTQAYSDFWRDFWDPFLKDSDFLNGNDTGIDSIISYTGFAITIEYTDGSVNTFKPEELSLVPLYIWDETGKVVSKIKIEVFAIISMSGTVTSWSVTGNYHDKISGVGDVEPSDPISQSGTSWNNEEEKRIYIIEHSTAELEGVLAGEGSGDYSLVMYAILSDVSLGFSDGTSDSTSTGTYTSTWDFSYQATGITSVKLSLKTTAL